MTDSTQEEQRADTHELALPPSKNHLLSVTSTILAFLAILVAAYSLYANTNLQEQLIQAENDKNASLKQLRVQQSETNQQAKTQAAEWTQTQNTLENHVQVLAKQLNTTIAQSTYQKQDWQLLKAEYYLEIAQVNSHWTTNYDASIALLQEADGLLAKMTGTKILEIRQVIAKEINQLQSLKPVDKAGLLSQLDAAQNSVTKLNIPLPSPTEAAQVSEHSTANWRGNLENSFSLLKKLVIIRRDNEDIKPLISPLFESAMKEIICLNLQEAQWAVLNDSPSIYYLMLEQASKNIKRSFNTNEQSTKALLAQLDNLKQAVLTQEKPSIGHALPLINQLIDNKGANTPVEQK